MTDAFKPASVAVDTPGVLEPAPVGAAGGNRVLSFDLTVSLRRGGRGWAGTKLTADGR